MELKKVKNKNQETRRLWERWDLRQKN